VIRFALIILCTTACAPLKTRGASLPSDVTAFIERREACDHFRGEEGYDAQRIKFLNTAMARTCTGSDAKLRTLRAKYANVPVVIDILKHYDADIEPDVHNPVAEK
jgi:hypothetical protein